MNGQTALEIVLSPRGVDVHERPLGDRQHFASALDLCIGRSEALWALSNGPLAATSVPGASELSLASRGAGGSELELASLADVGLSLDGLGRSPLVISGRCAGPSVLVLWRRGDDAAQAQLEAIDLEACLADGGAAGVAKRAAALCAEVAAGAGAAELRSGFVLACGPAARSGQLGAVVCSPLSDGALQGPTGLTARGAFGSRLLQQHGLAALVVASDRPREALLSRSASDGPFLGLFEAGMSAEELEHTLDISLDADLVRGGRLVAALRARGRDGGLWLNGRSVSLERGDREHYALAVRQGLVDPLLGGVGSARSAMSLGSPLVASGVCLDADLGLALGPQLGVLTRDDLVQLARRCYALGLEPVSSGAIVAWLLDGIDAGEIAPGDVGLSSAPPKWPAPGDVRPASLLASSPEIARAAAAL
ncbi:MAG: hypothetical protein KC503_06235, partial [Myxococcales bacterium]|nr:hypothetical protein [Myxococcales bacterium]